MKGSDVAGEDATGVFVMATNFRGGGDCSGGMDGHKSERVLRDGGGALDDRGERTGREKCFMGDEVPRGTRARRRRSRDRRDRRP